MCLFTVVKKVTFIFKSNIYKPTVIADKDDTISFCEIETSYFSVIPCSLFCIKNRLYWENIVKYNLAELYIVAAFGYMLKAICETSHYVQYGQVSSHFTKWLK